MADVPRTRRLLPRPMVGKSRRHHATSTRKPAFPPQCPRHTRIWPFHWAKHCKIAPCRQFRVNNQRPRLFFPSTLDRLLHAQRITAALLTAILTPTALAPSAQALRPGDKYVALGDSYASTGTITRPAPGSTPACVRDRDNYPHRLAELLNLQLDDATCAWAFTYQYDNPQHHALPLTAPSPQKQHLTPDTKIVTISLGGNDAGLAALFASCAPHVQIPGLPECAPLAEPVTDGSIYNPDFTGRNLKQRLIDIANDVKRRAPAAQIFFTGYYTAATPEHTCPESGFLSLSDRRYIESFLTKVNYTLKQAALESHTTYISPPNDDEGWCKPPHQRNSNFHGLPEGNLIAHPTALGQQHMAQEIARKVR